MQLDNIVIGWFFLSCESCMEQPSIPPQCNLMISLPCNHQEPLIYQVDYFYRCHHFTKKENSHDSLGRWSFRILHWPPVATNTHHSFSISADFFHTRWHGGPCLDSYPCMSLGLMTPLTGSLCIFTFCLLCSISSLFLSIAPSFGWKENESLGLQPSTRLGGLACPSLLPIQPPNMTPTILLAIKIPTAMLKYSVHTSTLNNTIAIEGEIYLRNPYVSKGSSDQKMKLLNYFLVMFNNEMGLLLYEPM